MRKIRFPSGYEIRSGVMRFMAGRNGSDELCRALSVLALAILIVQLITRSLVLYLLFLAVLVYSLFRMFSKNIQARQKENRAYCRLADSVKKWASLQKRKWSERKTHVYKRCPSCKNTLRLPRVKGTHTVNCPCCHTRFELKL